MTRLPTLILACMAGGGLGTVFFGGLWWTLRKGISSNHPALWIVGSALLRMAVTISGFYVVSAGEWARLLSCLLGFSVARVATTWLTRQSGERRIRSPAHEARHAS